MSKFLLPYKFKGVMLDKNKILTSGARLVNKNLSSFYLGEGVYSQFSQIYTDILQAIAENDREYLQNIMEPKLYERTINGIDEILNQNYKIKYLESENSRPGEELFEDENINQEDQPQQKGFINFNIKTSDLFQYKENDMKIYVQAGGAFGVNIQRHLNEDRKYLELKGRFSGRQYYLNSQDIFQLYRNQILILNVFFKTTRQLYIVDENDEVVKGNDHIVNNQLIRHSWRFETYIPNLDWVLVDMDQALDGNPYIPTSKLENKQENQQ